MTDMDKMMIEKVARAMAADQSLRHYELDSGSWEAQTDYGRGEWLHAARAAITAYNPDDRLREALELFVGQAVFEPETHRASVGEFVVSKARAALQTHSPIREK